MNYLYNLRHVTTELLFHQGRPCLSFFCTTVSDVQRLALPRRKTKNRDLMTSELIGLLAWNASAGLVRGQVAVDGENFDIAIGHIPGQHSYLKDLELFSLHHLSVDLLDTPMNMVMNVLFELLLGLVALSQALKALVQINEPLADEVGVVLAVGAAVGIRVDEFAVAAHEMFGRTPLCDVVRDCPEEDEDGEALFEGELLDADTNEPVEALEGGERLGGRGILEDGLWKWRGNRQSSSLRLGTLGSRKRRDSCPPRGRDTTTTAVRVVQGVDFCLDPVPPLGGGETLEANELRIRRLELNEVPNWCIG